MLCFSQIVNFENWEILSIFSNEPEAYNNAETDYSEVKVSVLSIFEEKFEIGCHLEIFSRPFSQKIEPKSKFTKTTLFHKAYFLLFLFFATFCINMTI
jgi:hypothetical protein